MTRALCLILAAILIAQLAGLFAQKALANAAATALQAEALQ